MGHEQVGYLHSVYVVHFKGEREKNINVLQEYTHGVFVLTPAHIIRPAVHKVVEMHRLFTVLGF